MSSPTQRPPASNPTAVERFDRSLHPVERDLAAHLAPISATRRTTPFPPTGPTDLTARHGRTPCRVGCPIRLNSNTTSHGSSSNSRRKNILPSAPQLGHAVDLIAQ
ncbi:MAG: hypothetical protein H6633_07380 [Anaerolineales bacterium]|nr:hypothetical protein [Anaerolineales bacterium]